MSQSYDLIIAGGEVVNHAGRGRADVGVRNGKTVAIGDLSHADAGERIDARGLTVLPGVIDTQVHFREPGGEAKEDLESGSRGAVLGGVTAVFEMPNTNPLTTSHEALDDKLRRAKDRMWCDHAFYVGGTRENADDLAELERHPGCCGVKMFMGASTGNLLTEDDETLRRIFATIRRRPAVHAEDEERMRERKHLAEEAAHPRAHPLWRDEESALKATRRIVNIAREAGKRVHVLHITSAVEMYYLAENKDVASVETTPQHLTLVAPDCYDEIGTRAQMNPPIRDRENNAGLWWGLDQGVVDVIGSDHAPHLLEEKARTYPASPSGMTGVQTLVPILLDHVNAGRMSLERFIDLTSAGANRLFQIAGKGRLAVGYDADFTLVDMKRKEIIRDDWIASKAGWTPFAGKEVTGWPVGTIIRGNIVMRDGELASQAAGAPMRFAETL